MNAIELNTIAFISLFFVYISTITLIAMTPVNRQLSHSYCSRWNLFQGLIMSNYYHTSDITVQLVFQSLILAEFMT